MINFSFSLKNTFYFCLRYNFISLKSVKVSEEDYRSSCVVYDTSAYHNKRGLQMKIAFRNIKRF